jgi:hypothetical protein
MFHPLITIAVSVTCSGQRVPISGQPLLPKGKLGKWTHLALM